MASDKGIADNPLHISWHDSAWIPVLNRSNVLKYFTERSNSFYDSTCNNEIIKMQNLSPEHLSNMTGMEYVLLHSQDPILHIVRKQMRHSPVQVTSIADYYIIAGIVYQAPDVKSVLNSRLTSTLHHINSAFSEAISYSRYHPSKGYWWQFNEDGENDSKKSSRKRKKKKEEPGSMFQCRRVDQLLSNLITKFPHKFYQLPSVDKPVALQAASKQNASGNPDVKTESVGQENPAQAQTKLLMSGNTQSGTVSNPMNANNLQVRVKTELIDGKPPAEKRTKFM